MRYFQPPAETRFYAGVDLHARSLYLVILDRDGQTCYSRNLPATPEPFLRATQPFREGLDRPGLVPRHSRFALRSGAARVCMSVGCGSSTACGARSRACRR